ncbi:hypothetical protein F4805DRAFT_361616 [Annulohypoxylon moriforme]|nr:hypothetical protein F4805DRAFT_361616 [Annulohypoxylon moriforme]
MMGDEGVAEKITYLPTYWVHTYTHESMLTQKLMYMTTVEVEGARNEVFLFFLLFFGFFFLSSSWFAYGCLGRLEFFTFSLLRYICLFVCFFSGKRVSGPRITYLYIPTVLHDLFVGLIFFGWCYGWSLTVDR